MHSNVQSPIGHWTSQLCARCHTSGLPICIGMYLFTRCTTLGEKQKVRNVVNWAANLHLSLWPIHIYLDSASRPDLHSMNQRYLCSIKSDRLKNLQDSLAEHVKQPGQWYGKYNAATNEVIVRHYSRDSNAGVKTEMSNAFKVNRSARPPSNRPAWQECKYSFSVCDDFLVCLSAAHPPQILFGLQTYMPDTCTKILKQF